MVFLFSDKRDWFRPRFYWLRKNFGKTANFLNSKQELADLEQKRIVTMKGPGDVSNKWLHINYCTDCGFAFAATPQVNDFAAINK